jgi:lysyl-tRNA synthetase class 2
MNPPRPPVAVDAPWRPAAERRTLEHRAAMLGQVRAHFAANGALEIEAPVLQSAPNGDPGISPLMVTTPTDRRWLSTSPEHPLKRLVAAGYGAVWSLGPVFRAGEHGQRHRCEFRMLEWYRPGWSLEHLIAETIQVLELLCGGQRPVQRRSYRAVFRATTGVDPLDVAALQQLATDTPGLPAQLTPSELRDLLMATQVESSFDPQAWTVISGFPPDMAAQARLHRDEDGAAVAGRFEIYAGGLELANGYDELDDADELERRLDAQTGGLADPLLLAALRQGLGSCSGVAVGFDRVVMLACGATDIAEVMAFPWERA